jgi:NADPH2:quinone reductase
VPEPGPGEVLVKIGAAALNPVDLYLRGGAIAMPIAFPYIPGCDLAGTVDRVGTGVTRWKPGDRVWGSNQGLLGRQGTCAEYASVGEEWLYPTPAGLGDAEAAAMALVGITAHLGLFHCGRLQAGETVYVPGGTGGVGSMVVQMARNAGARVATAAGSPEKLALCRELGAELALNYRTDDIPTALRAFAPEGIDVWYETQRTPDLELAVPLLRRRGRLILMAGRDARPTLPVGQFYPRNGSIHGFAMFNMTPEEQSVCAADMVRWVEAGALRALVGRVFPLAEAAQAQQFLEANTLGGAGSLKGKVVIQVA